MSEDERDSMKDARKESKSNKMEDMDEEDDESDDEDGDDKPKKEKKNVDIDLGNGETLSLRFAGKKTMEFWVWNGSSWSYSCPMNIKGVNMLWGKTK